MLQRIARHQRIGLLSNSLSTQYCHQSLLHLVAAVKPSRLSRDLLVRIAGRAGADMVKYASQFGFTPVARSRIAAGPFNQPPGKFCGLLGG
jgi:phage terminase small subunit